MISVVIPAYNEKDAIEETVKRALEGMREFEHEIVVVDDGSEDGTGELASRGGARVIRHPHNMGYGRSIKRGVQEAKYDLIAIMDADNTYPVERMPDLVKTYKEGFNMVVGARTGKGFKETWFKSVLRSILKWLVEFTSGRKIPDINSGMRLFSKKEVVPYFDQLSDSFSFTTSLTLAYFMTGKFVAHVPVEYGKRVGKSKVLLFRDALRTLQFIVQAIVYYNPIKIFLVLSGVTWLMALIALLCIWLLGFRTALALALGSLLTGILVFALGLLAVLLRQIMVKR